jgi:hypothetical protein
MGADIDEARHQHRAPADKGAAADDRAGHDSKAALNEALSVPAIEFRRDLVPPGRPAGPSRNGGHWRQSKGKQHRLLQPLINRPPFRPPLRDPGLAAVESRDRRLDGFPHSLVGLGQAVAALPGFVDDVAQSVAHAPSKAVISASQSPISAIL